MTNYEIIKSWRTDLLAKGKIKSIGTAEVINENGETITVEIPEQIHTYAAWKELGYQVQKGEKAVAKFPIWKHTTKTDEDGNVIKTSMFRKTAAFFTEAQVARI